MKKYFLFLVLFFLLPHVSAAQTLETRGLGIAPFLVELEVDKGGNARSEITLTNTSSTPISIRVDTKDFLPGYEGQPRFVPDSEINDLTFSIASWITIDQPRVVINPGQSIDVPFTIAPPADAEEGTHYGAVLFSFSSSDTEAGVTDVTQSVGTIVLLRYGQAREAGVVDLQIPQTVYFSNDRVNFTNVFSNSGNVHVKPKGEIYIRNTFGQIVATPFINKDASNVLPKTERTFTNSWVPSIFAFGRYTAESVVIFGNGRLESREKNVIWILPWYLLGPLIIILVLLIWFPLHGKHIYHRRVIRRHQQKL